MIFPTSRLVGYVSIPWRVTFYNLLTSHHPWAAKLGLHPLHLRFSPPAASLEHLLGSALVQHNRDASVVPMGRSQKMLFKKNVLILLWWHGLMTWFVMNVCLITSLKFAVMWQDPFEVVGGDVFFTTNSGLQIWEAWWFFMTADLSANLNKDVNNKYLLSTARMIHWEMDSVYLVNHVDWKWSLSKMFTKKTSIHVPLRSLDFRFRDAFLSTKTFLHATPTGGSFKSATDW